MMRVCLYSLAFKYIKGKAQAFAFLTHFLEDSTDKVIWLKYLYIVRQLITPT